MGSHCPALNITRAAPALPGGGRANVGNVGMKVDLPKVELSKLPLELYWIPQIDGEEEAIRVDL